MKTASAQAVFRSFVVVLTGLAMVLASMALAPRDADAQEGSGLIFGTVVTCIESDTVQSDPAAATMAVGNVYEGTDGTRHLITTGTPLCKFNCAMGFDINCDGIRGDFCPAGLNLNKVADVQLCYQELYPLVIEEGELLASHEFDAEVTGIYVVQVGELAYTGAETSALAYVGVAMLGAGALAMGTRRRLRNS